MNINMDVNGGIELTIKDLNGVEVDSETSVKVLKQLQNEILCVDLKAKTILIQSTLKVVYTFDFEVGEYSNFEFSKVAY